MATVYRIVRCKDDGTIVSIEGCSMHPGVAKGILKRARQSLGHNPDSPATMAKIQEMHGDWIDSAKMTATQRNPEPFAEKADPNRKTTFSKRDDNPLPLDEAGFVSMDNPPTDPHAIAAGLHHDLSRKRGKQFPL
jgi:hypothetical protein